MSEMRSWARVMGDVNVGLRRGAWYEVARLASDTAVFDLTWRSVYVPRAALEMVTTRPQRWSVVTRPLDAVDLPLSWGSRYAVCPECSARAPIKGQPIEMQCPRCRGLFVIHLD